MHFTPRIPAFAIPAIAALTLGGAALGQTMVGPHDVSDADLPAVTEHCRTLASGADPATGDPAGADPTDEMVPSGDMSAPATDGTEGNADAVDTMPAPMPDTDTPETDGAAGNADADAFSGLDLSQITLADCEAAGLTQ